MEVGREEVYVQYCMLNTSPVWGAVARIGYRVRKGVEKRRYRIYIQ